MNIKKWNTYLVSTVLILLILAVLILIKILSSNVKGFEWGSVSDWFSTIADLIMAGAALYAAWNANNWFRTKIKENALNQVTKFWTNCDLFSLEMLKTYENVRNLSNTNPNFEPKNFAHLVRTEKEVIDQLQIKLTALRNELQSLTFWKVSPKDESVFNNYFFSNQIALEGLREAIGFNVSEHHDRLYYNLNYGKMLVDTFQKLSDTHASLKKDMNNLFVFSN
ncbi:TPA: hypothetical protein OT044_000465 [Citrobacter koseri]|uniref:hypothetical protein n=1 Tax=Citrobacter koseri TaxID=545 RepID=UPI0022A1DE45|nr:hypothetical protein [Citrobacter koseri]